MNTTQVDPTRPSGDPTATMISLGAGVQSTVLALMADTGELGPKPDFCVFADTGWEPAAIYEHLDWLEGELSIPVHRVRAGNIRTSRGAEQMPLFVNGEKGLATTGRKCTIDYKIVPIHRKVRELIGVKPVGRLKNGVWVDVLMGISFDEIQRMKPSPLKWQHKSYPLVDRRITRQDCLDYFADRHPGRTLHRSACIGCPYHSDDEWYRMKTTDPTSWADAVDFDRWLRSGNPSFRYDNPVYLHRSLVPLSEIDFTKTALDFSFDAECEGMCGN